MLQIVKKDDVAKRKRHKFSRETIEKRNKKRRDKQMQKRRMAVTIIKIDDLKEVISDEYTLNDMCAA